MRIKRFSSMYEQKKLSLSDKKNVIRDIVFSNNEKTVDEIMDVIYNYDEHDIEEKIRNILSDEKVEEIMSFINDI